MLRRTDKSVECVDDALAIDGSEGERYTRLSSSQTDAARTARKVQRAQRRRRLRVPVAQPGAQRSRTAHARHEAFPHRTWIQKPCAAFTSIG